MSFYVEKVSRKSGACYRIVRDYARGGERKREYQVLPQGTTKAQAEKIRCQNWKQNSEPIPQRSLSR